MSELMDIIKDPTMDYQQRCIALAKYAENLEDHIVLSDRTKYFQEKQVVTAMGEGASPYRPRYVTMDFEKFFAQGSKFLELEPPKDIWEAVSDLMIIYHHIPGVTMQPVYIGHLDRLLEPFYTTYEETKRAVKMLLMHLDRTIPDSFCHCDIGPKDTKVGRIILELSAEMQRPVPNMSLIYNEETPDDFALEAIKTGLITAKPSFVNDAMYRKEWGSNYCIASCYNVLPVGGGGYTLGRMNLRYLEEITHSREELMGGLLKEAVLCECEIIDKRIQFIVDDCHFFENSFLAEEGLISRDKFVGMFGIVGLAELVNGVLHAEKQEDRYGTGEEANTFGEQILDVIHETVASYQPKYGKIFMHGQVGISTDVGTTPNVRVPVGEEPEFYQHLAVTARMQKNFETGVGDLFPFDATAKKNPQAVLDVIKGAFAMNMRYFSFYSKDTDVIRVTGYLVKLSEIEEYNKGKAVLDNTTNFGSGAKEGLKIMQRKVRGFEYA